MWWYPDPLHIGKHTKAICDELTEAVENYRKGISTYLLIQVPYRHGKSDILSRAFPAYFLSSCADKDPSLIQAAYGGGLAEGFSKDCKRIINSDPFKALHPGISIEHGSDTIAEWAIEGSTGRANFVGFGGSAVGKGAHFLGIDDYCKSRAEARSLTLRNSVWDAFRIDLMSRLAPVHIVAITATPWHVDDVSGRLIKLMAEDPDFPRFKILRFPATNKDGSYLFPQLYGDEWYKAQYALQGSLSSANLDCNPLEEGGNRFDMTKIQYHDTLDDFPKTKYVRAWDLASSKKERGSSDPDYTVGIRGTVTKVDSIEHLWIADAKDCREEAPKRDKLILATTDADDPAVSVIVERFGAYKDAYTSLKATLHGKRMVKGSMLPGDKEVKAAPMEQIFYAGNVHLLKAPWNKRFIEHFTSFPDGTHDDYVDATAVLYHEFDKPTSRLIMTR